MKILKTAIICCLLLIPCGCRKLGQEVAAPSTGEVEHQSYSIEVDRFRVSGVVAAHPDQLIERYLTDSSNIARLAPGMPNFLPDPSMHVDLTQVGQVYDIKAGIGSFRIPAKFVCLKSQERGEDREVWALVLTRGMWLLFRIKVIGREVDSLLELDLSARPSERIRTLLNRTGVQMTIEQLDILLAAIQAEWDPDREIEDFLQDEPRTEFHEALYQGYSSSIRVNTTPEIARTRIFHDPANLRKLAPYIEISDECLEEGFSGIIGESANYCPCSYRLGDESIEAALINYDTRKGGVFSRDYMHNLFIMPGGFLIQGKISIEPAGAASVITAEYSVEPPDLGDPRAAEIMMGIASMPELMESNLLEIQQGL